MVSAVVVINNSDHCPLPVTGQALCRHYFTCLSGLWEVDGCGNCPSGLEGDWRLSQIEQPNQVSGGALSAIQAFGVKNSRAFRLSRSLSK